MAVFAALWLAIHGAPPFGRPAGDRIRSWRIRERGQGARSKVVDHWVKFARVP